MTFTHWRLKNKNSLKLLLNFRSGLDVATGSRNQAGSHSAATSQKPWCWQHGQIFRLRAFLETRDLNPLERCKSNIYYKYESGLIQSTDRKRDLGTWRSIARGGLWASHRKQKVWATSPGWEKHLCKPLRRHGLGLRYFHWRWWTTARKK